MREAFGIKNDVPNELCFDYFDKIVSNICLVIYSGEVAENEMTIDWLMGDSKPDKTRFAQVAFMKCKLWDWMVSYIGTLPVAAQDEIKKLLDYFHHPLAFWKAFSTTTGEKPKALCIQSQTCKKIEALVESLNLGPIAKAFVQIWQDSWSYLLEKDYVFCGRRWGKDSRRLSRRSEL